MATKRTANGKAARATPAAAAKPDGRKRRAAPKVAVDGDLNPKHCRYDPAKGTVTLGLDVFDGAGVGGAGAFRIRIPKTVWGRPAPAKD